MAEADKEPRPAWAHSPGAQSWWGACGGPKLPLEASTTSLSQRELSGGTRPAEESWKVWWGECREENAEVDYTSQPNNNCVLGKQFCSRGLFIGMFFLSTPFPHLLPFVLRGAWQIGRGLQAKHRKLWNTMNGAGTDPHPLKNIICCSIQRPCGDRWSSEVSLLRVCLSPPQRR